MRMRIGVLEADQVLGSLRAKFGSYADMFEQWLCEVRPNLDFTPYDVTQGVYPRRVSDYEVYIITGSKASVLTQATWIRKLARFIAEVASSDSKLLGFCFGHQLIAVTRGGVVAKSKGGWGIGLSCNWIYEANPWMRPAASSFVLPIIHQEQVIQLPVGATALSGNRDCPYGMVQYGAQILSLQGHPEHQKEYTRSLMLSRQDLLGEDVLSVGLKSLEGDFDRTLIANWVLNFLES